METPAEREKTTSHTQKKREESRKNMTEWLINWFATMLSNIFEIVGIKDTTRE
jgi:hypothetical protein